MAQHPVSEPELSILFSLTPVVEELQVQILKLLLDNKDSNGVSGLPPLWYSDRRTTVLHPKIESRSWLRYR